MVHRRVTAEEFVEMTRNGDVVDAGSVAAYGLLLLAGRA